MAYILRQSEAERRQQVQQRLAPNPSRGTVGPIDEPLSDHERDRRREELVLLFSKWDIDGSGVIEFESLRQALRVFGRRGDESSAELHELFEEAIESGLLPQDGISQEQFVTAFMEVFDESDTEEFNGWIDYMHNTVEFTHDLTEDGRRKQSVFKVFVLFPKTDGDKVAFSDLETAVKQTAFSVRHRITTRQLLVAASAEIVPDNHFEFLAFQKSQRANLKLDLRRFHHFVNVLLLHLPAGSIYELLQQLQHALHYERRQHAVSKYLRASATEVEEKPGVTPKEVQHLPTPPETLKTTNKMELVRSAFQNQERNFELRQSRANTLRQEMRHSLDAVNVRDVEEITQQRRYVPAFEVVSTVVCQLLRVPPAPVRADDDHPYLTALRGVIATDIRGFIRVLTDFNTRTVTPHTIGRIMRLYHNPNFDSNRVIIESWFMAALCSWAKAVVQIVCLENDIDYPTSDGVEPACDTTPPALRAGALLLDQLTEDTEKRCEDQLHLPVLDTAFMRPAIGSSDDRALVGCSSLLPSSYIIAGVRKAGNLSTTRASYAGVPWPLPTGREMFTMPQLTLTSRPNSARDKLSLHSLSSPLSRTSSRSAR